LVNKYFLVGVTEDLESFVQILELTLPTFFRGASKMFTDSGSLKHIRKTKHKDAPSEETIQALQDTKVWKLEQEFYEFALSHFNWLKHEIVQTKGETKFHYEKIRPRPE
jgi:heparan sulfate 2-O-sulfotransferase HS2ST1